jgi:adenine deaminase
MDRPPGKIRNEVDSMRAPPSAPPGPSRTAKAAYASADELKARIAAARGLRPSELVIRGARVFDAFAGEFRAGDVAVDGGTIVGIGEPYEAGEVVDARQLYGESVALVPGFIDAHVHIESSLMTPARFQQAVLPCGTTAVIWDPHEIANVKGSEGIAWALEASEGLELDVFVMVPSCVPSTSPAAELETSGAELGAEALRPFRAHPRVLGLAEMMNFPGLLGADPDVVAKLMDFNGMKRDGHCPGLTGKDLNAYGVAGIHSCHESTTLPEAREKLTKGVHVLIREGSCAKDADTLLPILDAYTSAVVSLCSDDRNPADIAAEGHISCIVDKALKAGHRPEDVFRAASFAPARIYGLEDRGAIAPGYRADMVLVRPRQGEDWASGVEVLATFKSGRRVDPARLAAAGAVRAATVGQGKNLRLDAIGADALRVPAPTGSGRAEARVIGVIPRQILTNARQASLPVAQSAVLADPAQDVLKIAVLERHHGTGRRAVGFVSGFGLTAGAIATSINHDSHNVIVVGASDALMVRAVERLIEIDGGIVVVHEDGRSEALALPIGGLMTDADPATVTAALHKLKALAQAAGCKLEEPFLQLSFLALPVIPALKITDRGLVDVTTFQRVPVLL